MPFPPRITAGSAGPLTLCCHVVLFSFNQTEWPLASEPKINQPITVDTHQHKNYQNRGHVTLLSQVILPHMRRRRSLRRWWKTLPGSPAGVVKGRFFSLAESLDSWIRVEKEQDLDVPDTPTCFVPPMFNSCQGDWEGWLNLLRNSWQGKLLSCLAHQM